MIKPEGKGNCALHQFIRRRFKQPNKCKICNKKTKKLDLANISQKYKREVDDWEYLCRKCHMKTDGRLKSFALLAGTHSVPIIQKTKEGKVIKKWSSIKEAATSVKRYQATIVHCLNGKTKTCAGFKWEYSNPLKSRSHSFIRKNRQQVLQINFPKKTP